MPYLSNVGKADALNKESKTPTPVGEAAAPGDSGGHGPSWQTANKRNVKPRKITNKQDSCTKEVNHYNLSTEDFLKLLSC